jgi:hypothetical protein
MSTALNHYATLVLARRLGEDLRTSDGHHRPRDARGDRRRPPRGSVR